MLEEGFVKVVTVVLLLAYIGFAIWFICKRQTIKGGLWASAAFLCGGLAAVPLAEAMAVYVCWAIVIIVGLVILGFVFDII